MPEKELQMPQLLAATVEQGASDLHINVGKPPILRLKTRLVTLETKVVTVTDSVKLMKAITDDVYQTELHEKGSVDFSKIAKGARFRINVCKTGEGFKLTLRRLPTRLFTPEELGLPKTVLTLTKRDKGLVFVTGPTGSGKSTTLAAMVYFITQQRHGRHIITIEQPREYTIPHGNSLVTSREVPTDTPTFGQAIVDSLREDPEVVVVGEARDRDTMKAAITAAETGHLVFATLHTNTASSTVDRLIDSMPANEQNEIRTMLAQNMIGVVSQKLLPKADGSGVIAAYEIMVMTPAIANMIRTEQTGRIESAIQTGKSEGMQLLDDHLFDLANKGIVDAQDALSKASKPIDLRKRIDAMQKR